MDASKPPDRAESSMADLTKALCAWRDALVGVSLALQDYRFALEESACHAVPREVQELLEKAKRCAGNPGSDDK